MYDGCLAFNLADDWSQRIENFRQAFLPEWSKTRQVGATYIHMLLAHVPEVCRKYDEALSSFVSDEVSFCLSMDF